MKYIVECDNKLLGLNANNDFIWLADGDKLEPLLLPNLKVACMLGMCTTGNKNIGIRVIEVEVRDNRLVACGFVEVSKINQYFTELMNWINSEDANTIQEEKNEQSV